MVLYDLAAAIRSLRRYPALSGLMIGALAVGIAASMVTMTLYHGRAGHPIWWKEDRLFAVTLDNRSADPQDVLNRRHPEYPPFQLTYKDARALYESRIPVRSVMMFRAMRLIEPAQRGARPINAMTRVTTADFFTIFDVPFLYGNGWPRAADDAPEAVAVLSKRINQTLFAGANSVGRSVNLNGHEFRIIGVLDLWMPQPKFYDLNSSSFDLPEDVYIPIGWAQALEIPTAGGTACSSNVQLSSYKEFLTAECIWLQFWVELPTAQQREQYQRFIDNYTTDQRRGGRFARPNNNRLVRVSDWLEMNDVVGDETRSLVVLAVMFLVVCILSTFGLMLARFSSSAPNTGLRRALGATRADIMRQHLTEVVVVGFLGGAAGLALAFWGLRMIRALVYLPTPATDTDRVALVDSLVRLDAKMLLVAVGLSFATGILAGLYPAWRMSRLPPATALKAQ